MRRKLLILTVVGVVSAGVMAGVAVSVFRDDKSPRLGQIASSGRLVAISDLTPRQAAELRRSRVGTDEIRLLGEPGGTQVYVAESTAGQPCFLSSRGDSPNQGFRVVACLGSGEHQVPSEARPVVDFSAGTKRPGEAFVRFEYLAGIAANRISAVGLIDRSGAIFRVPARNNVYGTDDASVRSIDAVAFVAFDARGEEVFRQPLTFGQ
jgi:hypothetical protein